MNIQTIPDFSKVSVSGTFPFRKTEKILDSLAKKSDSQQTDEEYRELLEVFIREYSDVVLSESLSESLSSKILNYLLEETRQTRFIWYYTLSHQYIYYLKYSRFDTSDINFTVLTDILHHPEEYIDTLSNKYVFPK